MANVQINMIRKDNLASFPSIFKEVSTGLMTAALGSHKSAAIQLSPVDRGFFRNGFATQVEASGLRISGSLFNTSAHAGVIEGVDAAGNETQYGRRPGAKFPPVGELRAWVTRKLGITGQAAFRVAYLIGRSIVRRGILPVRPMKIAAEIKRPEIERMFAEDLPREIERRL